MTDAEVLPVVEKESPADLSDLTLLTCGVAQLKSFVATLRQVVDEALITVSPSGVVSTCVDSAHACMVCCDLPLKSLTSVGTTENTTFAISLTSLEGALKVGGKSDSVTLTLTDKRTYLEVNINGLRKSIRLLDASLMVQRATPTLDLKTSLSLSPSDFKRGVDASKSVGDTVGLYFDGSDARLENSSTMESVVAPVEVLKKSTTSVACQSNYSTAYITYLLSTLGDEIWVSWGNDLPLKLQTEVHGMSVEWFIAPRSNAA